MRFEKDLRKLNENEFKQIYKYLKEKTNNFTIFYPDLIIENNQYLLLIRIFLGLSQERFANKLGTTKDWCRHIEARRNKIIHLKVASRYHKGIERLLDEKDIKFQKVLENWKKYKFASYQEFSEIKEKFKPISKMTEKELKKFFETTKEKTNNFTFFEPKLLLEIPQSILIFRIVGGLNHEKFAELVGLNSRSIRAYESLETRLKPRTIELIMKKVEELFKKRKLCGNIKFKKVLENFRILTGFYGHRNLDAMVEQGVRRLARLKQNQYEVEISDLLKNNEIPFEPFGIINGIKKKYNIDFVIPNSKEPKIIIETFMNTIGGKSKNTKSKICNIDHRFQSLKLKNPDIKTITAVKLVGRPILLDFVKKSLGLEIFNTDCLFINEEIKKLPRFIKRNL